MNLVHVVVLIFLGVVWTNGVIAAHKAEDTDGIAIPTIVTVILTAICLGILYATGLEQ